jgi:hypothetical protein
VNLWRLPAPDKICEYCVCPSSIMALCCLRWSAQKLSVRQQQGVEFFGVCPRQSDSCCFLFPSVAPARRRMLLVVRARQRSNCNVKSQV